VIDFRYHVVSIVAVFLALSVGIVLGSSFLSQSVLDEVRRQASGLRTDNVALRGQVRDLQRDSNYRDQFVTQVAPTLVTNRLDGQSVVLITLPGADANLVEELREVLTEQAGARVTGEVAVEPKFTAEGQGRTLETLVRALRPPDLNLPEGTTGEMAATELAHVLMTRELAAQQQPVPTGEAVLNGWKEGGFLDFSGTPQRRAGLAVVVAPPSPQEAPTGLLDGGQDNHLALVKALDATGRGTVVAGSERSAEDAATIGLLRSAGKKAVGDVSTVDTADTPPGRVAVVLALVAETSGKSGHYGVRGRTDGPLPPILKPPA
jgi:hypothetical protein